MVTAAKLAGQGSFQHAWIRGGNFSGRSDLLRNAITQVRASHKRTTLLPAEISHALSGLARSVAEEIQLHRTMGARHEDILNFAAEVGLNALATTDPFRLSGGEQSLLALVCKLLLDPAVIAVDCSFEQLDKTNLARVLAFLSQTRNQSGYTPPAIWLAHNGALPSTPGAAAFSPVSIAGEENRETSRPVTLGLEGFYPPPCARPVSIALHNLSFHYVPERLIFSGLNLELRPGKVHRLVGPNGSGKSTAARIITGILAPTKGEIRVDGAPVDVYQKPGSLARLHFQSPDSQLFADRVENEVESLGPELARQALSFAGLTEHRSRHPFDLPFVLRKRLALSAILYERTPWLILDEPTVGQDEATRRVIAKAIRSLADTGRGIILISHDEAFARDVTDHEISITSHAITP